MFFHSGPVLKETPLLIWFITSTQTAMRINNANNTYNLNAVCNFQMLHSVLRLKMDNARTLKLD